MCWTTCGLGIVASAPKKDDLQPTKKDKVEPSKKNEVEGDAVRDVEVKSDKPYKMDSNPLGTTLKPPYKMDSNPLGKALIINNRDFSGTDYKLREGTDIDADKVRHLFQKDLSFEVNRLDDQTAVQMQNALQDLAKANHSKYDCVVVVILSHGEDGKIIGTDGKGVPVDDITGYFKSNPTLKDKPKLFFIQACRGKSRDAGIVMDGIDDQDPASSEEKLIKQVLQEDEVDAKIESVTTDADLLLSYATTPGFASWRDKRTGSWYIQALVEVIENYAAEEHLTQMLTMVNHKLATEFESHYGKQRVKQMPAPLTKLTKKLFFKPQL
jgi:hypothetical protein